MGAVPCCEGRVSGGSVALAGDDDLMRQPSIKYPPEARQAVGHVKGLNDFWQARREQACQPDAARQASTAG